MTLEEIENGFTLGKDTGFTHMVVFKDIFSNNYIYFYGKNTDDIDKYIEKFTEVDTYRLVGILNYALPFKKQIESLNLEGNKKLVLN